MKKNKVLASQNKAENVETRPPPPIVPSPRQRVDNRQAVQFIDSIVALSPVSRQTHIQVQQALQQISGAIGELEQLKKTKTP